MKTVSIFLGSSIVELKEDRDAFSDIVAELNAKLKTAGYFIYLDKCEYENGFLEDRPTQDIIDEKVRNSSYSYFIVRTKFGEYTQHEFDIALEMFLKTGKPRISVMFRRIPESEKLSEAAQIFQNRLKELRYYYKEYQNNEELKLNVVLNLVVDNFSLSKEIKAEDGGIYIGNIKLIDTELIPVYAKHSRLSGLREQLNELELQEQKLEDKRERRLCREKIRKIEADIREIERLIYQTMLGLTQAARGKITPLLSRAMLYIENGDIERATEILNVRDVIDELKEYQDKTELSIEGIQSAIETTYVAIETMIQLPESLERSNQIEFLFEKIILLELQYNLNRVHCGLYVRYLLKRKKYDKAEKYIRAYIESPDTRINSIHDFALTEYALLGMQLYLEPIYKEDPQRYQDLYVRCAYSYIQVFTAVVDKFPNSININPYMVGIFCDRLLDTLNKWVGEKDDAIKEIEKQLMIKIEFLKKFGYYKVDDTKLDGKKDAQRLIDQIELKKECEKLNDEPRTDDPKEYLKQYSGMLKNLLNFFQTSNNMFLQNNSSIPRIFKDYEKLISALEENREEDILLLYSQIKIGHAEHYTNIANFDIAEKDYRAVYDKLKALSHQEEIYKSVFCVACCGLSITLSYLNKHEEAENILLEGIGICEELVEHEYRWRKLLARMYTNYVVLCMSGNVYDCINKGMEYAQKAYTIFDALDNTLDDTEKMTFINLCYNYSLLFLENGRCEDAFTYIIRSLDIVNLLHEKSIQENYELISNLILLSIHLGIKLGNVDQIREKLEPLYSMEAIDSLISELRENVD